MCLDILITREIKNINMNTNVTEGVLHKLLIKDNGS